MQQINLYRAEFRPNREPLRAIHMAAGLALFLVLLFCVAIYSHVQNANLTEQIAQEKKSFEAAQLELQKLSLLQPKNQAAQLELEKQRLEYERDRRKQILSVISRQDFGNAEGFSGQLQSMARQSLDTVAVDAFSLQKGGTYLELSGKTSKADQVPLYIQRLRTEPAFARVGFGVLTVERKMPGTSFLDFNLANPEMLDKEKK